MPLRDTPKSRIITSIANPPLFLRMKLVTFFSFSFFLLASPSHAIADDYCVADYNLPRGPAGYSCKDPSKVIVDDFIYTGFRVGGPTTNTFGNSVNLAFANVFPGINGQGISMARLDFAVGGVIPMHTHRTSEVFIAIKGSIIAGFIDTNNTAYYKTLEIGDVMVFPEGMLHFQVNVGKTSALAFVALNSANPGIQLTDLSLFAGNLPAVLAEKTMLINHNEVRRLRKAFGNTN